jgi:hypothetical protein
MPRNNPCFTCRDIDCDVCPIQNSTPVKLHTPKGAVRAMLVGKVLCGEGGRAFYFDKDGFFFDGREENREPVTNFSGLWEEL